MRTPRLRIAFVADTFTGDVGGGVTAGRRFVERLQHDHEVIVVGADADRVGGVRMRPMQVNPAAAHMFIVNPFAGLRAPGMANLFSTHPPIEDRVRRLREMARRGM